MSSELCTRCGEPISKSMPEGKTVYNLDSIGFVCEECKEKAQIEAMSDSFNEPFHRK